MGDNDRAEPYLATAQRIDPAHFTRPQLYLARIYLQRGDVNRAKGELEDFIKRYPDAPETKWLRERLESRNVGTSGYRPAYRRCGTRMFPGTAKCSINFLPA